jgi:Ca2+-binding EF-hand superfamily protein
VWQELIAAADADRDGELNYDEFSHLLSEYDKIEVLAN